MNGMNQMRTTPQSQQREQFPSPNMYYIGPPTANMHQHNRHQSTPTIPRQYQDTPQQQQMYNNQAAAQVAEYERELLAMRGQYERDQIFLEQYDRVRPFLSLSLFSN